MPKIAVYAGHGGTDSGAIGNGVYEKDINLAIELAASDALKRLGYQVVNNRTTDTDRSIAQDAQTANERNADALVEIHMNSNTGTPASGSEAFYSVFDKGRGKELADAILANLQAQGFKNRGSKTSVNASGQDTFGIIRLTKMPAVLLETAFINNASDLAKLNVNDAGNAVANAVARVYPIGGSGDSGTNGDDAGYDNAVIRQIQINLNARYSTGLTTDGIAGPKTRTALVKAIQSELNRQFGYNLVTDGVFGSATRAAAVNVHQGARGSMTYLIQAALYLHGYTNVVPDGVFGSKTKDAVLAFQRSQGLSADGVAGANTQYALFRT